MRNIRLTIAYDGSSYVGWQVQPNGPTVQVAVEKAIKKLTGLDANVLSAGRTDSGVHALGQVASFQTESTIPLEGFRKALHKFLPDDVIIRDAQEVPLDFHATFSAVQKRYRYVIHNCRIHNPFLRNYVWHFHQDIDAAAMHDAGQELIGKHDFRSFESHWPNKASSVRTIKEVTVRRQNFCPLWLGDADQQPADDDSGEFVWVEIVADGFLYNMVRAIVGTLVPVGRGRWGGDDIRRILTAMDRSEAGDTAPPNGLYLVHVDYENRFEVQP
jgi:tRNA pseudouridine38-40 synthase